MQGLAIRVAKGLNRVMHRRGRVFGDRYHARPLRTPTEVRRALVYVRENARKHGVDGARDPYASPREDVPLPPPRSWLLRVGWRRARAGPSHGVLEAAPAASPQTACGHARSGRCETNELA